MDEYKRLLGCVKGRDPDLSYGRVNDEIDKIIARYSDPRRILETLICHCEAKSQNAEKLAMTSIAYAVFLAAFQLIGEDENIKLIFFILLVILGYAICLIVFINPNEYKKAFVLKCLQLRYEKIQHGESRCKELDGASEEHMYIVSVHKRQ